jgi:hypothetical protein
MPTEMVMVGGGSGGGGPHLSAHLAECFQSPVDADITIVCRDARFQCHKVCKFFLVQTLRSGKNYYFMKILKLERMSTGPVVPVGSYH